MQLKLTPTNQVVLTLSLISAGAIYKTPSRETLIHFLLTVVFATILFYIFKFLTKKTKELSNTITTSLIIFLVVHNLATPPDIYFTLAITFLAIASKFLITWRNMPIINPAVFGLLAAFFIGKLFSLTPFISWWGAAYTIPTSQFPIPFALIILAIWIIFGLKNWRKFPLLITFLIAHAILLFAFTQNIDTLKFIFTDATIYFLAAIMLIEPKTSPILKNQQIIFALVAALTYNVLNYFGLPLGGLFGILLANLYFFGQKYLMIRKNAQKSQAPA